MVAGRREARGRGELAGEAKLADGSPRKRSRLNRNDGAKGEKHKSAGERGKERAQKREVESSGSEGKRIGRGGESRRRR